MTTIRAWLQSLWKNFTAHWVTFVVVAAVLALVIIARVISNSSTNQATPSTTSPTTAPTTATTGPTHAAPGSTNPPSSNTTQPSPTPPRPSHYLPLSALTTAQRKATIAVTLAFSTARTNYPKLLNAALTRQLTKPPTPAHTTLVHGLGTYPGHPQVIELSVAGARTCYQAAPLYQVPPRPIVCP